MTATIRVVIRCDGSAALGMGHVSRCLALADAFREEQGSDVGFSMRGADSAGVEVVRAAGYVVQLAPQANDDRWLANLVVSDRAQALVVDVRDDLSRSALDRCRAELVVATIDDISDRRLASDLAFYPPVPQVDEVDWSGFEGRRSIGWDWAILRREFAADRQNQTLASGGGSGQESASLVDVLMTMGGSDPAGMTEFTIGALDHVARPLSIRVVLGPAFARAERLADLVGHSRHHVEVVVTPPSMLALMRDSRIAISSFGVTAYELAAAGVPAVHLCLTEDHVRSSSAFERALIARTAGMFGRIAPLDLATQVVDLLDDPEGRAGMRDRARRLVDGRGASRVAQAIADAVSSRAGVARSSH